MIELWTTNGFRFLISDIDADRVAKHRWRADSHNASGKPYVKTTLHNGETRTSMYLHRFITGCPRTMRTDHRDNDGLNNQRPNLRISTHDQNNYNRGTWSLSGYKGVSLDGSKWRARITYEEKCLSLGSHALKEDAARAYDAKANELFGEFAWLNFPEDYPQHLELGDTF